MDTEASDDGGAGCSIPISAAAFFDLLTLGIFFVLTRPSLWDTGIAILIFWAKEDCRASLQSSIRLYPAWFWAIFNTSSRLSSIGAAAGHFVTRCDWFHVGWHHTSTDSLNSALLSQSLEDRHAKSGHKLARWMQARSPSQWQRGGTWRPRKWRWYQCLGWVMLPGQQNRTFSACAGLTRSRSCRRGWGKWHASAHGSQRRRPAKVTLAARGEPCSPNLLNTYSFTYMWCMIHIHLFIHSSFSSPIYWCMVPTSEGAVRFGSASAVLCCWSLPPPPRARRAPKTLMMKHQSRGYFLCIAYIYIYVLWVFWWSIISIIFQHQIHQ